MRPKLNMQIQFLGAHNIESSQTRMSCLLIDGVLALDAGSLTSNLTFEAQTQLKAICLTHAHYDHLRDIPALGMNLYLYGSQVKIGATQAVYDALARYLTNEELYPNWFATKGARPATLKFVLLQAYQPQQVEDYTVTAVPVVHSIPAVGYQVTSGNGRTIFYSGDTGTGLAHCWRHINPQLLIMETTASNRWEDSIGRGTKHLTPRLLHQELTDFRRLKGYLPRVLLVHMNPDVENEIKTEVDEVARELDTQIDLAYEGMQLEI